MDQSTPKSKLLCILRFLQKSTDRAHAVTVGEIIAELAENGIKAERKSVYRDLKLLRAYGFAVTAQRSREVRYFLEPEPFSEDDLRLLADAAQASPLIARRRAGELARKLASMASGASNRFDRPVFLPQRSRESAEQLYNTLDLLQTAIRRERRVAFSAGGVRHGRVDPYLIVAAGGTFLLIAGDPDTAGGLTEFALETLGDLSILAQRRENAVAYTADFDFSLQRYAEGLLTPSENLQRKDLDETQKK